jgi:hypothetical protein
MRGFLKKAAIEEAMDAMVADAIEIAHEEAERLADEWAAIAEKEEPCGACGGFCYYHEVKGEPCSMFREIEGPDGVLRGPSDWEFEA